MYAPQTIAIIGFGRFGRLWAKILSADFEVLVYDPKNPQNSQIDSNIKLVAVKTALTADVIFYCLPISSFEQALAEHSSSYGSLLAGKLLVDTLSVKLFAKAIFEKYAPRSCEALLTHPLFGPDSTGVRRIVVDSLLCSRPTYQYWQAYFESRELAVIEMNADDHDKQAARSQGLTHLVCRILEEYDFTPTAIDTNNCHHLLQIKEMICADQFQLFVDMQKYNPYCEAVQADLIKAQTRLFDKLSNAL